MSENTQSNTLIEGSKPQVQAFQNALMSLYGKELLLDEVIGIGYLFDLMQKMSMPVNSLRQNYTYNLISENGQRTTQSIWSELELPIPTDLKITQSTGSIIKIPINGMMTVSDSFWGEPGMQTIANVLGAYSNNPNVAGAILEVNSGGGEAAAGQLLFNAVGDFKKPLVSYVHNAGSGMLMGILKSKEIIAAGELARVGSVGAYQALDKMFFKIMSEAFEYVISESTPDKISGMIEYMKSGSTKIFQQDINHTGAIFQKMVSDNRDVKFPDTTLKGGMFNATSAKARGLVDAIGSESLAIKRLKSYIK